jgi:glycosyltransferase involved in cell wall biosynthesis
MNNDAAIVTETLKMLEERRRRFGALGALDYLISRQKFILSQLDVAPEKLPRQASSSTKKDSCKASKSNNLKKVDPAKQINVIRTKLLSLGFTERPLAELTDIANNSKDSTARALSARELALWYMRTKTEHGYRLALTWIACARINAADTDFRTKLATVELLCHYHLNQHSTGLQAFDRATKAGETSPDLLLARANFEHTLEGRVEWINKVLAHYNIEPVSLLPDDGQQAYDRLTCAVPLPKITVGPRVTVLIAAYDAANMLPTALRSLQEQTWANLEIIILDDCSPTMDTMRVGKEFAAKDPRIQVVRMAKNGGAYVARNCGLDMATGEFVTLHDADDWSHPRKIETQVRFMMENTEVLGCTTQQSRATENLIYWRINSDGKLLNLNTSSFMFRRKEIKNSCGYWDEVRFGADTELIGRIKSLFGNSSIKKLFNGPFSFQRISDSSIVGNKFFGIEGFHYGARFVYHESYCEAQNRNKSINFSTNRKPLFATPNVMLKNRLPVEAVRHFNVIIGSDFRMAGGTTRSSIEEILCHQKFNISQAHFHIFRYDFSTPRTIYSVLADDFDIGNLNVLAYGEKASCDLLILRYPPTLQHLQRYLPEIDAKEIKVIINQTPMSNYGSNGEKRFDFRCCAQNLREYFKKDATWHPIGPLVREALHTHHADQLEHINLSNQDWHNIIEINDWDRGPRKHMPQGKLRIGRHSRDDGNKWPDCAEDILAAYPDSEDITIHILGGSKTPAGILGNIPKNWVVHGFGSIHPRDFLRDIDVWVYFANPAWVESFGRTIIEAIAAGVPVILPEIYYPLFKDAAIYATPQTSIDTARKIYSDVRAYEQQVERARDYIRNNFSYESHVQRLQLLGMSV